MASLDEEEIKGGKEKVQYKQEKRTTEDEMVGWHHRLNGHEFKQTPGDSGGQERWQAAVRGVAKSWTRHD